MKKPSRRHLTSGATYRSKDVFLNVPFDKTFEPLLVALVAGLAALGFSARSVLEIPPSEHRLDRLLEIISACGASVHDLSWVKLDRGKHPRFNMPFELGLAVAISRQSPRRRPFFVFEAEQHRLGFTLSDLNGYDPLIHRGKPDDVLLKLHGVFEGPVPKPTIARMRKILSVVQASLVPIKKNYGGLFSANGFRALAMAAEAAARKVR